ncbi:hypothetical protein PDJAM_G00022860 [Pangasius djambal]|uniref:Uncharacterized protein n=1 Tax=Pangasius djambal TaxID=1691987 RepID=A0ACC5YNX8_9TELE|nr:hypothetical protein [Pangasius djambal]
MRSLGFIPNGRFGAEMNGSACCRKYLLINKPSDAQCRGLTWQFPSEDCESICGRMREPTSRSFSITRRSLSVTSV